MTDPGSVALFVGGLFNLGFAIFHLMFWRLFRWKEYLASLTSLNRAVMQILNLCLTFMLLVLAYASFFHTSEMRSTSLGRTLLVAVSFFWFLRMVEQIIFFRERSRLSLAFTFIFLFGSAVYAIAVVG